MFTGLVEEQGTVVAIGPEVGVFGGGDLDGHGVHGVTFGLGLYTFDTPSDVYTPGSSRWLGSRSS